MLLEERLHTFASGHDFPGSKGALSVALVITRVAAREGLPLDPEALVTGRKGQVRDLSGSAVKQILADHGIDRVLAKEGGRTSRGSISNMRSYVGLLNELDRDGLADFPAIERWWIGRVRDYFARSPIKLRLDPSLSTREAIRSVLEEAEQRQAEGQGSMVVGAVMQHLVGAKLSVLFPGEITSHGSSVADAQTGRTGDFTINGYVIHVTARPTERLLHLCASNLAAGLMPMVVTTADGVVSFANLSQGSREEKRVEVLDIEHFLVTNITEWAGFQYAGRKAPVEKLVAEYNRIVDECETDPGLRIELA